MDILIGYFSMTRKKVNNMKDIDLVVQFAVLWGMYIGSAVTVTEEKNAKKMKEYDSEELSTLLTGWKDEYLKQNEIEDSCDFFNLKLENLMYGK